MRSAEWREWAFAVLLYVPVLIPLTAHYLPAAGDERIPTGFLQYDQPYYMANARQYLDGATDGLRYALPFSADPAPEPIYFQPQIALLALLWRVTGLDPGLLLNLFGLVFGVLCVRSALRVLREVLQRQRAPRWLEALFLWGGGLLFAVGLLYGLGAGEDLGQAWSRAFRFDPANGYWFMNLGRNLLFPLEAYYHFLFFTLVLLVLKRRFGMALVVSGILWLSHPFTAVAALVMIVSWSALTIRSSVGERTPGWFLGGSLMLLLLLLVQHRILLPANAEHALLMEQWAKPWTVDWISAGAAYALVGALACWRLASRRSRPFPLSSTTTLLLVWVLTWFALEHHELIMTAVQPAHFTRGYLWAGLFLLGAPVLVRLMARVRESRMRWPAAIVVASLMLADNTAWFAARAAEFHKGEGEAVNLTRDTHELFDWLAGQPSDNALLVAEDPMVAYMGLVYTPCHAYYSHRYNTPNADQRSQSLNDFFAGRITDPLLEGELLVISSNRAEAFGAVRQGRRVFSNAGLTVDRVPAIAEETMPQRP